MFTEAELRQLADDLSPEIRLNPQEKYQPSSVEFFLNGAEIVRNGSRVAATSSNLRNSQVSDHMLIIDEKVKYGSFETAKLYCHIMPVEGSTTLIDFQYWVFYPYNGAGTLEVKSLLGFNQVIRFDTGRGDLSNLGAHEGDWERVTVRVDQSKNIIDIRCSVHETAVWHRPRGEKHKHGFEVNAAGQPIVYSSRNGHPHFVRTGNLHQPGGGFDAYVLSFQLINECEVGGNHLNRRSAKGDPAQVEIIKVDLPGFEDMVEAPDWLYFKGVWGPKVSQTIDHGELEEDLREIIMAVPELLALLLFYNIGIPALIDAIAPQVIRKFVNLQGPTTPSNKDSWHGEPGPVTGETVRLDSTTTPAAITQDYRGYGYIANVRRGGHDNHHRIYLQYNETPGDCNTWQKGGAQYIKTGDGSERIRTYYVAVPMAINDLLLLFYIAQADGALKYTWRPLPRDSEELASLSEKPGWEVATNLSFQRADIKADDISIVTFNGPLFALYREVNPEGDHNLALCAIPSKWEGDHFAGLVVSLQAPLIGNTNGESDLVVYNDLLYMFWIDNDGHTLKWAHSQGIVANEDNRPELNVDYDLSSVSFPKSKLTAVSGIVVGDLLHLLLRKKDGGLLMVHYDGNEFSPAAEINDLTSSRQVRAMLTYSGVVALLTSSANHYAVSNFYP